jgi:predicted O-methyltransferase YrrM
MTFQEAAFGEGTFAEGWELPGRWGEGRGRWMAVRYACERQVIELALESLRGDGLVARDAVFNYEAPGQLRREVAYRDFDFLSRLSRVGEVEIVSSALRWLKARGLVPEDASYDEKAFDALRQEVKARFSIPGTSLTPVMERLLYMLGSVKRPQRVLGLGTYCGYALLWAAGPSCGPERAYQAEAVYGIDVDAEATERARENMGKLAHTKHVALIAEDGLDAAVRLEGPFDYVFLDVESQEMGKGLYLELLKKLEGKIEAGGWVLAHDTVVPPFAGQLAGYLDYVRDKERFRESVSFDVDAYGLELSIK